RKNFRKLLNIEQKIDQNLLNYGKKSYQIFSLLTLFNLVNPDSSISKLICSDYVFQLIPSDIFIFLTKRILMKTNKNRFDNFNSFDNLPLHERRIRGDLIQLFIQQWLQRSVLGESSGAM
ncbi:hypothetical protein BpHYR1_044579, partial [Brachionus plicatilis]